MSSLFTIFQASLPYLMDGFQITIQIWAISIVLGVALGLVTCLLKLSPFRPLRAVAWVYIWIIRGTPMLVQAMVVYFGVPQVTGLRLTPFTAGVITLSLNAGAYLSEIFRSGIQAVPKGQSEAARSLGLGAGRTMVKIVLPQAFKIAIPVHHHPKGRLHPHRHRPAGDHERGPAICDDSMGILPDVRPCGPVLPGSDLSADGPGKLCGEEDKL